ncbi:regulatory LuxR family protein [Gillisia mitskevichiae]|uniref:Regulatory LuxR family protein n=1 Tax=Gillisia mitskevichiae TaxID=270921 RepID=A0A495PJ31_9FLAO|nr:LuxR C-terminal-related transcriptional regulator [Gillisia mitskevichiae]RKS50643.1 regulatory LuxR family protein [Gillisia mitskevichiae]
MFKINGMRTDKKQLLVISDHKDFSSNIAENLSVDCEINSANSIHTGYNLALDLLPDIIIVDQTSLSTKSLKNISNFKSTHFLNKCYLVMYADENVKSIVELQYKNEVNEVIYNTCTKSHLYNRILKQIHSKLTITNYWKDSFMGLFNILVNPVILLQQDTIIAMNDSFKESFKLDNLDVENIKLTDFVDCKNKTKVRASLRNFARGKHMKAVTKTSLKLKNNKTRNAKISFSKLDKLLQGQFIMMIHFFDEDSVINEKVGSSSENVENCFEENSNLTEFCFTKREKEIIQLLCKGYKTKEISDTLYISPKTIEKHRANIVKRTNSDTILESIIYAVSHNLIDLQHNRA